MDFWSTLLLLRRRWYVFVPALALAGGLTALTYLSVDTRYESTAVLVLTSPSSGASFSPGTRPEDVSRVNPLLTFDGSLTTTAQILGQVLRDPATQSDLGAGEGSAYSYTAGAGDLGGPFLFVTVEGETAVGSEELVARVVGRADSELERRQRELLAPESTFITTQLLVEPTEAAPQIGGKVRFAGAAAILMIFLSLATTFAADKVIGRRRLVRSDGATEDLPDAAAGSPSIVEAPSSAAGPVVVNGLPAEALRPMPRPPAVPQRPRPSSGAPRPHPRPSPHQRLEKQDAEATVRTGAVAPSTSSPSTTALPASTTTSAPYRPGTS